MVSIAGSAQTSVIAPPVAAGDQQKSALAEAIGNLTAYKNPDTGEGAPDYAAAFAQAVQVLTSIDVGQRLPMVVLVTSGTSGVLDGPNVPVGFKQGAINVQEAWKQSYYSCSSKGCGWTDTAAYNHFLGLANYTEEYAGKLRQQLIEELGVKLYVIGLKGKYADDRTSALLAELSTDPDAEHGSSPLRFAYSHMPPRSIAGKLILPTIDVTLPPPPDLSKLNPALLAYLGKNGLLAPERRQELVDFLVDNGFIENPGGGQSMNAALVATNIINDAKLVAQNQLLNVRMVDASKY